MDFALKDGFIKTGYLSSQDQTEIFFRHYSVPDKRGCVFLIHGFGEHSGRYFHVMEELRKQSIEIWAIDLRGHGHSKGRRGDISQFYLYEQDVWAGLKYIHQYSGQPKLFVLAHSMGALIALRLAKQLQSHISGMILSCPLLGLKTKLPWWQTQIIKMAAKFAPLLHLKSGIKGYHLSSDPNFSNAYDNDPLVLKYLSIRTFWEIFNSYQNVEPVAKHISSAFFMQLAESDPVVDTNASLKWFDQIDPHRVDATCKLYPGFLHEIYSETHRMMAINDLILWLKNRL